MLDTTEIIEFVRKLAEEENLRVNIKEALKGGCIAGGAAAAGGVLLGPPGILIGGALGSLIAYCLSKGKFLSIVEVIAAMEEEKLESLAQNMRNVMNRLNVTDVAALTGVMAGNVAVRDKVVSEVVDYFRKEMSMAIVDH